ncbi:MAG: sugar phosphate isomerase/epimerase [Deltaproteobacteria bacterium]|nr:sugar phosphate isomerase/epimerase [Deltaproteobacteria bacterium]
MCNFISDPFELKRFALDHGFDGIDWTFSLGGLPRTPSEDAAAVEAITSLSPLELRFHCAFNKVDLGHHDRAAAHEAMTVFRSACRLVSKVGGKHLTIHVGLGHNSTTTLSWTRTIERLSDLARFGGSMGISICLENLGWGWSSRPELFEKMIRKSGAWATVDIGHAYRSSAVQCQLNDIDDFVTPHPERVLNAHIYHEEANDRHLPPRTVSDLEDRLDLLRGLPLCDWWVLELRGKEALLETLHVVREYFRQEAQRKGGPEWSAGTGIRVSAR